MTTSSPDPGPDAEPDPAGAEPSPRRRALRVSLLLLAVVVIAAVLYATVLAPGSTPRHGGRPAAVSKAHKLVFAHYFPPFPISIDNEDPSTDYYARNYLTIGGENGKHAAGGGYLRDRPIPRQPLHDDDWQLEDLRTEVRQAKAAGIDGFTLNVLTLTGQNWTAAVNLMQAAEDVGGFSVVPNLDGTASASTAPPQDVADKLAELYAYPSAQKVDGAYLLSSFAPENRGPQFWSSVISHLEKDHHLPIRFIAVFLNAGETNMKAFAPFSYGFGNWGVRTVAGVGSEPNFAARAHALGKKWMAPVAFQDARPKDGRYAESGNTETLRALWGKAISQGADYVQMVTWNDYSESTQFAPSVAHGDVLLDINKYYAAWFRSGKPPRITHDHLFVTHRIMLHDAPVTSGIANMVPNLGGATTPPRDTVEALVFLTKPAQVSITTSVGTSQFDQPAGVSAVTVPLAVGTVSAEVSRDGRVVKQVTSPYPVVAQPEVQDFQYWAAGS